MRCFSLYYRLVDANWTAPNHTAVEGDLLRLSMLVATGQREIGCDGICLHLLSARRDAILLQVVSSGYVAGPITQRMLLDQCPAVRRSLFHDEVIAVDDALVDPRVARRAIEVFGIKACVYAPLRVEGAAVGIVIASRRAPHRWTAEEIRGVRTLGRRAEHSLRAQAGPDVRVSG